MVLSGAASARWWQPRRCTSIITLAVQRGGQCPCSRMSWCLVLCLIWTILCVCVCVCGHWSKSLKQIWKCGITFQTATLFPHHVSGSLCLFFSSSDHEVSRHMNFDWKRQANTDDASGPHCVPALHVVGSRSYEMSPCLFFLFLSSLPSASFHGLGRQTLCSCFSNSNCWTGGAPLVVLLPGLSCKEPGRQVSISGPAHS